MGFQSGNIKQITNYITINILNVPDSTLIIITIDGKTFERDIFISFHTAILMTLTLNLINNENLLLFLHMRNLPAVVLTDGLFEAIISVFNERIDDILT